MRSAPVQLDDLAFRSPFKLDPIIQPIGTAETEYQTREHVAHRTLQRQAYDDRDGSRGRNQPLHRKVEYVGDDGEESCQIDKPSQDVLEKLAFPRTEFEDEHDAQDADEQPSRPDPPRNLQHH